MLDTPSVDGAELMLDGMPVGIFKNGAYPRVPGHYRYEPYRGPGHYAMVTRLRARGEARCYYDQDELRVSFTVRDSQAYGMLALEEFDTQLRPC